MTKSPYTAKAREPYAKHRVRGQEYTLEEAQLEARDMLTTPELQAKWLSDLVKSKNTAVMWMAVSDVAYKRGHFDLCQKAARYAEQENTDTDKVVEAIVSMGFRFKIKKNPFKNWVTHIRK